MKVETSKTVIRPLSIDELDSCIEGGKAFYEQSCLPGKFVPELFIENWKRLFDLNIAVIIGAFVDPNISPSGAIGGIIYPDVNDGVLVATEMFWFVNPLERNKYLGVRLFREFEQWALSKGAKRIIMVALATNGTNVSRFYELHGFRMLETQFIKEI